MTNPTCPFCALTKNPDAELLAKSTNSVAFYDRFPSAPGHVLVVPTIHVGRLCELPAPIAAELFDVVLQVQRTLQMNNPADAYTIGVNDGPAAGQTIPHVHVHLIPRRSGDTADPRGGVRWAIKETADYWSN